MPWLCRDVGCGSEDRVRQRGGALIVSVIRLSGVLATILGRPNEAIDMFRRSLGQDPLSAAAYHGLGCGRWPSRGTPWARTRHSRGSIVRTRSEIPGSRARRRTHACAHSTRIRGGEPSLARSDWRLRDARRRLGRRNRWSGPLPPGGGPDVGSRGAPGQRSCERWSRRITPAIARFRSHS